MTPPPGILSVGSSVTRPERCSEETFCEWYENLHVDEVVALSGVSGAVRYDAVPFAEVVGQDGVSQDRASQDVVSQYGLGKGCCSPLWAGRASWLTLYEMDSVEFKETKEFKGLDGQSAPKGNLLDEIFRNARFETRFGELVFSDDAGAVGSRQRAADLLVSTTLTPASDANAEELVKWFKKERVGSFAKLESYVRTRLFRLVDTSVLHEFVRRVPDPVGPGGYLALHEFSEGKETMVFKKRREYGRFLDHSRLIT
ncbi:hypothetical protein FKW77_009962 [Venturia effusa]|uniref:EthD domain-containing protein n=1 Tax=Venturia effusa TaxID=50376 RepID=A0A517L270_9PEZI|nr:hypothetical protein FKW77_009962 [Venturia effusa]